jgi:hypothetical protein
VSENLLDLSRLETDYGRALTLVRNTDLASYLAVLIRMAQIGDISVAERNLAVPIAHDLNASYEETVEALLLADGEAPLSQLVERLEHPAVRTCLYRDVCRIALADGPPEEQELSFLEELRSLLGIDPDDANELLDGLIVIQSLQRVFRARINLLISEPA